MASIRHLLDAHGDNATPPEGLITAKDSETGLYYGFVPANGGRGGEKRGRIVFTTGYNGSFDFYYETLKLYSALGYDVWAMDWDGRGAHLITAPEIDDQTWEGGKSTPSKSKAGDDPSSRPGLHAHIYDLHHFVTNIVEDDPDTPLIMSTHSMGGHIGLLFMRKFPDIFDGAILAAPMIDINTSMLPRGVFRKIVGTAVAAGMGDQSMPNLRGLMAMLSKLDFGITDLFNGQNSGHSLRRVAELELRKQFHDNLPSLPSWAWISAAYPTIDKMKDPTFFEKITAPAMIVTAGRDELVYNPAHTSAAKSLQQANPLSRQVMLKDARHHIWTEHDHHHHYLWKSVSSFLDDVSGQFNSRRIRNDYQAQLPATQEAPPPARVYDACPA